MPKSFNPADDLGGLMDVAFLAVLAEETRTEVAEMPRSESPPEPTRRRFEEQEDARDDMPSDLRLPRPRREFGSCLKAVCDSYTADLSHADS